MFSKNNIKVVIFKQEQAEHVSVNTTPIAKFHWTKLQEVNITKF